jgi:5-methylcytosine-specific restriction enzyme subunit McrC
MPRILTLNESGAIARLPAGKLPSERRALELSATEFDRLRQWDERTAGGREGRMVFEWLSKRAVPNGFVGIIQHKKLLIELLPKLTSAADQDAVLLAQRNLQVMLTYALGLKHKHTGNAAQKLESAPLSSFLIERFAELLREELGRGISHGYQQREERLGVLRGRLDLRAHLSQQGGRRDLFAVRHEVFVQDTPLNQALRAACTHMLPRTDSAAVRAQLGQCLELLDEVSVVVPEQMRWETLATDRTNARFEQVLVMARMLLQSLSPAGQAGDEQIFALLYRMDALYERFVAGFLEREVVPQLTEPGEAPIRLVTQGGKPRRYLFEQPKTGELKPDLMLVRGEQCLVLDTKWKQLSLKTKEGKNNPRAGITVADLYQMVVYGYTFQSPRVVLVYPDPAQLGLEQTRYTSRIKLEGSDEQISVETLLFPMQHKLWRTSERRALAQDLKERLKVLLAEGAVSAQEQGLTLMQRVVALLLPQLPEGFGLYKSKTPRTAPNPGESYIQLRHKNWPAPLHYELLDRQGGKALRVDLHNELSAANQPLARIEALNDLLEALEPVMQARVQKSSVRRTKVRKTHRKPNWLSISLEHSGDEELLVSCMLDLIAMSREEIDGLLGV